MHFRVATLEAVPSRRLVRLQEFVIIISMLSSLFKCTKSHTKSFQLLESSLIIGGMQKSSHLGEVKA